MTLHAPQSADQHAQTLAQAEARLAEAGAQFTPLRRRVLELLMDADGPAKAYDLLKDLEGVGAVNPPTIYRALNFLMEHNLIHKIESLNAYIACCHEAGHKGAVFLICEKCQKSVEAHAPNISDKLEDLTMSAGFKFNRAVIEVRSVCEACQ